MMKKFTAVLGLTLLSSAPAFAGIVYDNTLTPVQGKVYSAGNAEFGDEILLGGNPVDRVLTGFDFEYYLTAANGNETGQVFIRAQDGPNGSPGTVVYNSAPFSLVGPNAGNIYKSVSFTELDLDGTETLPEQLTWTVAFTGLDAGEEAGLLVYSPPTIGNSFNTFWENTGAGFNERLLDAGATPGDFAFRVTAVPEPSTWALMLTGLGFLGLRAFRRKA